MIKITKYDWIIAFAIMLLAIIKNKIEEYYFNRKYMVVTDKDIVVDLETSKEQLDKNKIYDSRPEGKRTENSVFPSFPFLVTDNKGAIKEYCFYLNFTTNVIGRYEFTLDKDFNKTKVEVWEHLDKINIINLPKLPGDVVKVLSADEFDRKYKINK